MFEKAKNSQDHLGCLYARLYRSLFHSSSSNRFECIGVRKYDSHRRPLRQIRLNVKGNSYFASNCSGKIKSESGSGIMNSSILACEAFVKNSRQVMLLYAWTF